MKDGRASAEPVAASLRVEHARLLVLESRNDEALAELRAAFRQAPSPEIACLLASLLNRLRRHPEALDVVDHAFRLDPRRADLAVILGTTQLALGQVLLAVGTLERAATLGAETPEFLNNLATAYRFRADLVSAGKVLRRALRVRPDYVEALINLGGVLAERGERAEALSLFDRAYALRPSSPVPRFCHCMAQLPALYENEADIDTSRRAYERELCEFASGVERAGAKERAALAGLVGSARPFFLAYQGRNERVLQGTYGRMIEQIMTAAYPAYSTPLTMPKRRPGERIRVGIVSSFFFAHSNWKIPIRGWLKEIDREDFEVFGFACGGIDDECTLEAQSLAYRFESKPRAFSEWCETIRSADLHVLIYPEIGMDATVQKLAALRLAPCQAVSWGHPITSGLPTIDYFLSSDAMEPELGETHYTETLVRLPNLGVAYSPLTADPLPVSRSDFGVRDDAAAYWCCQSLFKYLPNYDDVFPRIAEQVPAAQFVFIEMENAGAPIFQKRLREAFLARGLSPEKHLVFVPPLAGGRFQAMPTIMDVFLDSLGWSGCNSTMEALLGGLPVVTLTGDSMRARHSAAILSQMGMADAVSPTIDAYVRRAVELGTDHDAAARMSAEIAEKRACVLTDKSAVRGLEDFMRKVASA